MGRVERDQLKYSKIRTKDKFVDQFNYWLINLLPWRYCLELWSVELWYHWIVILVTFQNKYIWLTIITHVAFHNKNMYGRFRSSPWALRCPRMPRRTSSASTLRKLVGDSKAPVGNILLWNTFKILRISLYVFKQLWYQEFSSFSPNLWYRSMR